MCFVGNRLLQRCLYHLTASPGEVYVYLPEDRIKQGKIAVINAKQKDENV
jgi:hypothetical protein